MAYAIMRCKKIKTAGGVASALQHCYRERQTDNADATKLADNVHLTKADNVDTAMGLLRDRLPEKRRKDAVLMVEYMMTASPDWWETADEAKKAQFFKNSLDWLKDKYGSENVIVATIHNDETTPHLSAFVTPITNNGRLSAKEFIGNKSLMSKDQTSYAEKVAHLGLKRGIKGSKAKHQTIQRYYEILNKSLTFRAFKAEDLKPKKEKLNGVMKHIPFLTVHETPEGIAERLNHQVQDLSVKASNFENMKSFAEKRDRDAKELKKELDRVKNSLLKTTLELNSVNKELKRRKSMYDDFSIEQRMEFGKLHEKFTRENNERKKAQNAPRSRGMKI